MEFIQIIWLAIVQGLTEFLPISSSAHLILVPPIFGWPDQGLAFDVAVHLGTLIAVVTYFRRDIAEMFIAWLNSVCGGGVSPEAKLAWGVLLGTIPVGLAGLFFKEVIETYLRSPLVIASTTVIFGLLLWGADSLGSRKREVASMTWGNYLFIGVAQAIALIPGTSRSGITITAALMLGFNREAAARFSFLLSIPVIVLSSALVSKDLVESAVPVDWLSMGLGVVLSGICAFFCIHFFLKWIKAIGMLPFVIYRLMLGAVLLYFFL